MPTPRPVGLTGFPVNSVTVVLGYETQTGIQEVIHVIDGTKSDILSVQHTIVRKSDKKKDDKGNLLAFEATGEEELVLRVKYIRG
jgi:hypothetical protein